MMAMTSDLHDFVLRIMEADEESLELVQQAINLRRQTLSDVKVLELKANLYVGDRVKLSNLSKKWLNGLTCEVIELRKDTVVIEVREAWGSENVKEAEKHYRDKVGIPYSCCTKV